MKLVCLFLSIILIFSIAQAQQSNPLIEAIYGQVGKLDPEQSATSTSPYVYDIHSIGFSHFAQSTLANLQTSLAPFNLPANVISQIQTIVYMQSTNFMGFNFVVSNDQATLTQYAGCARNVQGTVQVACVTSETHGATVQQYNTVTEPVQTCKFCTDISKGFRCCSTTVQTKQVAVGFTTEQLEDIENALAKAGMAYIQTQLANPPADFQNYNNLGVVDSELTMFDDEEVYQDPITELLDILLQTIDQLEDYIQKETPIILNNSTNNETDQNTTNTTTLLKTIFGSGYQTFQQSAVTQKFQGVYPQYTQQFLNLLLQQLDIPATYLQNLNSMISTVLKSNLNKWVIFSVLFSQNASQSFDENNSTEPITKYVCLIGRKNSTNQQTDWVSANIEQTFTLQPDILIMRHCYYDENGDNICNTENVEEARTLSPLEEEDLFDFFEVAAFKTIVKTLQSTEIIEITQQ